MNTEKYMRKFYKSSSLIEWYIYLKSKNTWSISHHKLIFPLSISQMPAM
jgi:hypothetical protein